MEIGIVYSDADPQQCETLEFLRRYIDQHGIRARIIETPGPVESPTIMINGHELKDQRKKPRGENDPAYPGKTDIARALDLFCWAL